MKNKLLTFGSIGTIAVIIPTAISCGVEDLADESTYREGDGKGKGNNDGKDTSGKGQDGTKDHSEGTTFTNPTSSNFINRVGMETIIGFLVAASSSQDASEIRQNGFIAKDPFTVADYEQILTDMNLSAIKTEAFKKILRLNDNDPKVAASVIAFTYSVFKNWKTIMAFVNPEYQLGLIVNSLKNIHSNPKGLFSKQREGLAKFHSELNDFKMDYATITSGLLRIFSHSDNLWESTQTFRMYQVVNVNQIYEADAAYTHYIGGNLAIKEIVEHYSAHILYKMPKSQ